MSEEVNLDIHGQLEKLIAISRREVVEVVEVLSDSHKGSCDAYRDCMFRFVNAIINGNSLDDLHKKILPLDNPRHDRADEESKVYRGAYRNTIKYVAQFVSEMDAFDRGVKRRNNIDR